MADSSVIKLPEPRVASDMVLAEILRQRRSLREFAPQPLSFAQVAQLLWAAQGVTSPEGLRTAPSAGALYPLEIYLVVGQVKGLAPGSYRYDPNHHTLQRVVAGDLRTELAHAAFNQMWIEQAPATIVISGVFSRATWKYGKRGIRYVYMEAGHAGQNLFLQAVVMGLGTVVVGAFDDDKLRSLLDLSADEQPISVLPVGYPRAK